LSDVIVIPDGAHSILGPSSAERWLNCPGSVLLPGQSEQTEYAAEGTAAHTLSEWARNEGKSAAAWKGKILRVGAYDFKVGKAMIEGVDAFVDSVKSEGEGAPLTEERVDYEELVPGGFGTTDHARLRDNLTRVKDFKFGKGVVVAAGENPQLMLYALGVYFKYRWLYEFDRFVLSIFQPRVHHYDEWETSLGKLLQWGFDVVRPGARRALTPGAEIKAGPWCRFCKVKETCSVRAAYKASHDRSPDRVDEAFVDLDA
jgi:Protein of unknown function (DUF2800)